MLIPGSGSTQDNTLSIDIAFTVPASKTLEARSGVPVNVLSANSMTVNGTADLGDGLTNNGTVMVNSANTLKVAQLFINAGKRENGFEKLMPFSYFQKILFIIVILCYNIKGLFCTKNMPGEAYNIIF